MMNEDMTAYISGVRELMRRRAGGVPLAYVRTYGCQQNVADGDCSMRWALSLPTPTRRRTL